MERLRSLEPEPLALQIAAPHLLRKHGKRTDAHKHTAQGKTKEIKREKRRNRESGTGGGEQTIGDGCRVEGAEEGWRGRASRWRPEEEAGVPLRKSRPPVPRRPYRPLPQAGPVLPAHRHRRPCLPRRRPRVPRRRGPRAGGERGAGQQEEPYHPAARAAGDPQRRGARQAACRRHHRARWGAAQHQPRAAPQEVRLRRSQGRQGEQGEEVAQENSHQVAQEALGQGSPGARLSLSLCLV